MLINEGDENDFEESLWCGGGALNRFDVELVAAMNKLRPNVTLVGVFAESGVFADEVNGVLTLAVEVLDPVLVALFDCV